MGVEAIGLRDDLRATDPDAASLSEIQLLRALYYQAKNGTQAVAGGVPTTSPYTQVNVSFSSSGDNTVVSGTNGQTIRVFAMLLTFVSPVDVTIKEGDDKKLTIHMGFERTPTEKEEEEKADEEKPKKKKAKGDGDKE